MHELSSRSLPPMHAIAYLRSRGWKYAGERNGWAFYRKDLEDAVEGVEIAAPLLEMAHDYPMALDTLLKNLEAVEERSSEAIQRDMLGLSIDRVRFAIGGPRTLDGRIPLTAAGAVYTAVREIVAAAASSVEAPRFVAPKRKSDAVAELLGKTCFSQPEAGSYVVVVDLPVPAGIAPSQATFAGFDEVDEKPFARRTSEMIASSMDALASAVRDATTQQSFDSFERAVARGVSANVCEAAAEMLEKTDADYIGASVSFASMMPGPTTRHVRIERSAAEVLRGAGKALKRKAPIDDALLEGPVYKLEIATGETAPIHGGTAYIHAEVEGQARKVRLALSAAEYQTFVNAHRDGRFVRCAGTLRRAGAIWELTDARELVLLESDDGVST